MKHTDAHEQWTSPTALMEPQFHRISFALFRTDGELGRILAARTPDRTILGVGDFLQARLHLSGEAMTYLVRPDGTSVPLFILTDCGLGLLSKRYDLQAGVGLYLHIHTRPEAGARLLNSGAFGRAGTGCFDVSRRVHEAGAEVRAGDEDSYEALADAMQVIRAITAGEDWLSVGSDERLDVRDLQDALEQMARFVGCGLAVDRSEIDRLEIDRSLPAIRRVTCYRPRMLECLLLYLMAEVRDHAWTRSAKWRIGALDGDGGHLSMTLRYTMDLAPLNEPAQAALAQARSYMQAVADVGGLQVYFPPILPKSLAGPGEMEQVMTLEWLTNPSVLVTGDLKARLRRLYESSHPAGDV